MKMKQMLLYSIWKEHLFFHFQVEIYTDRAAGYITIETNGGNGNKGQNGDNGIKGADSQHKVTPPPHQKKQQ